MYVHLLASGRLLFVVCWVLIVEGWLLCKEVMMAVDSPDVSVQRITTFQCSLGVLAASYGVGLFIFDMRSFRNMT